MAIKYYHDIEQGGNAWFDLRLGVVTASNINILLTPKGKPAKNEKVRDYAYELVAQRLTWRVEDTFLSYDMERGQIQEDIARGVYNDSYADVCLCGFITNTDHGFKIGASPDGLVGDDGGLEIKSRKSKFQIQTVATGIIDPKFMNQIQACLLVSGRKWWDFCQYSNGMPLFVKRVFPDAEIQQAIIEAVKAFEEMAEEIRVQYEENVKSLVKTKFIDIMMDDEIKESEG